MPLPKIEVFLKTIANREDYVIIIDELDPNSVIFRSSYPNSISYKSSYPNSVVSGSIYYCITVYYNHHHLVSFRIRNHSDYYDTLMYMILNKIFYYHIYTSTPGNILQLDRQTIKEIIKENSLTVDWLDLFDWVYTPKQYSRLDLIFYHLKSWELN